MTRSRDELRIEELSERSAVSVRNIRQYQDRGLLPAPRREGRVVLYNDDHLARLLLISRLLARGYTLAVIRDLLNAWADGRELDDVLGLETAASRPWGDDTPLDLARADLDALFHGKLDQDDVLCLVAAGILEPRGAVFHSPRARLLEAFAVLVETGIPVRSGIEVISRARPHLAAVADDMVELVVGCLLPEGIPPGDQIAELADAVGRLRGIAEDVTASLFGLAMETTIDRTVSLVAERGLQHEYSAQPSAGTAEG